jgi:hypothetical protein
MRPPFFQATIAKSPQSNFHRHITVLPQDRHPLGNQPSPISATKMCAFDSRCTGLDCLRRPTGSPPAKLDLSIGRSGPHAFAVREDAFVGAQSALSILAATASRSQRP